MSKYKIAYINFIVFFIGWVTIFLLGADFPPPMGFIWIVLLILILDVIQSYYLRVFFNKTRDSEQVETVFKNALFYLIGGLIIATLTSIPNLLTIEALVWIAVVTLASVFNSVFILVLEFFLISFL